MVWGGKLLSPFRLLKFLDCCYNIDYSVSSTEGSLPLPQTPGTQTGPETASFEACMYHVWHFDSCSRFYRIWSVSLARNMPDTKWASKVMLAAKLFMNPPWLAMHNIGLNHFHQLFFNCHQGLYCHTSLYCKILNIVTTTSPARVWYYLDRPGFLNSVSKVKVYMLMKSKGLLTPWKHTIS